jgi:zinc protease
MLFKRAEFFILFLIFITNVPAQQNQINYSLEKYFLPNGLEVILQEDKSDPIVAVAVQYHVGSTREEAGKTGIVHLLEGLMSKQSQHVRPNEFFQKIQNAGGTLNGGSGNDGTIYFSVIPQNYLEMALWLESDRMGYVLSTITQEALYNQKLIIQNEIKQKIQNQPYGYTNYIIGKLLYSNDHPYSRPATGYLSDLSKVSLREVHDFFKKYYTTNNSTLVISGNFDKEQTKKWIEKYFAEIPSSAPVDTLKPRLVTLSEYKRAYFEDNFAKVPELNMIFPTVNRFHKDSYALTILSQILAGSMKSPLIKTVIQESKLAPSVSVNQNSLELAGTFEITVRTLPDKKLSDVEKSILEGFKRFEKEGFSDEDLQKIKAKLEISFYNRIAGILGRSAQLAGYNEFAGSPDFMGQDLANTLSVTREDVMRVYDTYINNKKYVLTSFVPKGKPNLAADNSFLYPIIIDSLTPASETTTTDSVKFVVEKIPSSSDRTKEPPEGSEVKSILPPVWDAGLSNGIRIFGIEQNELPLTEFTLTLKGGMLAEDINKPGVSNLLAGVIMEGTKNKTSAELSAQIEKIGSTIRVFSGDESIVFQASCLANKFEETYKLIEEIIFEPRWDSTQFQILKLKINDLINRNRTNPQLAAESVLNKKIFGGNNPLGLSNLGTIESIASITLDDLKNYYNNYFSPNLATITVVGNLQKDYVVNTLKSLELKWQPRLTNIPGPVTSSLPDSGKIFLIDSPGAKQSEIRIGSIGLSYNEPDFFKATIVNYNLGGSFNSLLNKTLRDEKRLTNGVRTTFNGGSSFGTFLLSTTVPLEATTESVKLIREEINKYRNGISNEDLNPTKEVFKKINLRRFESISALREMLNVIANYNLPLDYIKQQELVLQNLTVEEHKLVASKYLLPDKMFYVIVGDAAVLTEQLKQIGLGNPVIVDTNGNEITK